MSKFTTRQLATAGIIAALYAVLAYFAAIFGVAYGPIQCRFSEALCVLPFLFPETTLGLFVGCILTNLISMYGPMDVIFGSLATLIGGEQPGARISGWRPSRPFSQTGSSSVP